MNKYERQELIVQTFRGELEEAKRAGALGFMARAMTQATIPHSKVEGTEFVRKNGDFSLTIFTRSKIGLPYGSVPRLLLAWVTTEAVKKKERELMLGDSLSEFMRKLELVPTGGRWGSITRLKEQSKRLFSATITCEYEDNEKWLLDNVQIVDRAAIWWEPKKAEQTSLWNSTLTLSQKFFDEITESPIPIDMRAIKYLKKSPLSLDIYSWLTYRMSYLRQTTTIPWGVLQMQFGVGYPETAQGCANFKVKFKKALKRVLEIYPEANVLPEQKGFVLRPSKTHVAKLHS